MQPISVPANLLGKKHDKVVKVIIRGVRALTLPPLKALFDNGIIKDDCYDR